MCLSRHSLLPRPYSQFFNVARFFFSACNIEKLGIGPGDEAKQTLVQVRMPIYNYGYMCMCICVGSLDIIDTRTCSHVQTVPNLGFSIDSVSISCNGTHTAIAAATQYSGTFNSSIQANIIILLATDGCSWERRALLPQCGKKVKFNNYHANSHDFATLQISKVSLFPYKGDTQSHFAILYSTSTSLHFCPLKSTPTSVLASVTDGKSMSTCITCFDFSPSTIACGTSAFGYQVRSSILLPRPQGRALF